jgi:acetate kinase
MTARDSEGMVVLALNCGSSSVKFRVFDVPAEGEPRKLASGGVERIGGQSHFAVEETGQPPLRDSAAIADHRAAVRRVIDWARSSGTPPKAVGHRVVHGGARYVQPVLVDMGVDAALHELETLAPLHNGPSLEGIRAARAALGDGVANVAVFDTAFHATLPERAARYAIPRDLADRHGIRRYGFHGISYQSVLSRYCRITGTPVSAATLVALHLGNGASAAAIDNGRSVDTSMGLTPLEGLVMGTRSGDLDPALVGHLARLERASVDDVESWLNERSGLLGLAGSSDMRDLLEREAEDDRARLAVEIFCYRARKYVGAYLAALGGARAVAFSGGIGERSPEVRARICEGMGWCGLALEPRANAEADGRREALISAPGAALQAWVIPTDEEAVIAQETRRVLTTAPGAR